jgi:replicative DNA helicase
VAAAIAAEEAVLGGLMLDTARHAEIDLAPEDFTTPKYQSIYRAIRECIQQRIQADVVTVSEILDRMEPDGGSWLSYCAKIVTDTPSSANTRVYAAIVKRYSDATRAKGIAHAMIEDIDQDPEALDRAIKAMLRMTSSQRSHECMVGDTLGALVDYLDFRAQNKNTIPGMLTGLQRLDRSIGGLQKGHLIVVAARPGMGKTALMGGLHMANRKVHTGCISAEMPRDELVLRMVSSMSGVAFTDLRMGNLQDHEWSRINTAFAMLKAMPLHINDRSAPTIEQILRQARQWKYEHDIQMLSMDYIQRIPTPGGIQKRNEGVEHIVRSLKECARDLEIPVVALSAVSREAETRGDKRPLMSDLRDSGAIEAEADVIVTVYREEVYSDADNIKGVAELAVIKNRHGPLGRVTVHYNGPTLTFSDFRVDGGDDGPGGVPGGDGTAQRSMELGLGQDDRTATRRTTGARTRKSVQKIYEEEGR